MKPATDVLNIAKARLFGASTPATTPMDPRPTSPATRPFSRSGPRSKTQSSLEMSTADGQIVLGGALGTITLLLTAAETAALSFESGVFELEMTYPGGDQHAWLEGKVQVEQTVTR
jgi:hypothetical protein